MNRLSALTRCLLRRSLGPRQYRTLRCSTFKTPCRADTECLGLISKFIPYSNSNKYFLHWWCKLIQVPNSQVSYAPKLAESFFTCKTDHMEVTSCQMYLHQAGKHCCAGKIRRDAFLSWYPVNKVFKHDGFSAECSLGRPTPTALSGKLARFFTTHTVYRQLWRQNNWPPHTNYKETVTIPRKGEKT